MPYTRRQVLAGGALAAAGLAVGATGGWFAGSARDDSERPLDVDVAVIGARGDYQDAEGNWKRLCQISGGGAVLVRPDTHVAWRSKDAPARPAEALADAIRAALRL